MKNREQKERERERERERRYFLHTLSPFVVCVLGFFFTPESHVDITSGTQRMRKFQSHESD